MSINARIQGHSGLIELDRPQQYNALNAEMIAGISQVLHRWLIDASVRSIIITSSSEKAFAAGADINELAALAPQEVLDDYGMAQLYSQIANYPKPIVAAVRGLALGGGFELALACDIRVAHPESSFAFPELSLGILPGAGGTQRLAEAAGQSVALHYILTGERMSAQRAFDLGVITAIADNPLEHALSLAATINTNGPLAQRLARTAIKNDRHASGAGHLIEELSQAVVFSTPERAEGLRAFADKRPPAFHPSADKD